MSPFRPGDPPRLRKEIKTLLENGFFVDRPSDHQLKIGELNYYWGRGTITRDPCNRLPEKGFDALLKLLRGDKSNPTLTLG